MELMNDTRGGVQTTIRNTILVPFVQETIDTLESMADLKAKSDLLSYHDPLETFTFKDFAVCLITRKQGVVDGKIVMIHDLNTALTIGNAVRAKLLGACEHATTLNTEVGEALAEFANTVIGLALRHLKGNQMLSFGTPMYIQNRADNDMLLQGVKRVFTVPIDLAKGGRFYFSYLLHRSTE